MLSQLPTYITPYDAKYAGFFKIIFMTGELRNKILGNTIGNISNICVTTVQKTQFRIIQ